MISLPFIGSEWGLDRLLPTSAQHLYIYAFLRHFGGRSQNDQDKKETQAHPMCYLTALLALDFDLTSSTIWGA